ncbi:MAG: hypothetical protein ACWA44_11115 [Thiotrichales bacterium]
MTDLTSPATQDLPAMEVLQNDPQSSAQHFSFKADNWLRLRQVLAALLLIFAFLSIGYALVWFVSDFVKLSVDSPNLAAEGQVLDFDHLAYVSESLRSRSFFPGATLLLLAILLNSIAVNLLAHHPHRKNIFVFGGLSLLLFAVFLMQAFYWPVLIGFLLTAIVLYLTTELRDTPGGVVDTLADSDQTHHYEALDSPARGAGEAISDHLENAEKLPEPVGTTDEPDTAVVNDQPESLDDFVREIATDINMDTEADYQLAALRVSPEPDHITSVASPEAPENFAGPSPQEQEDPDTGGSEVEAEHDSELDEPVTEISAEAQAESASEPAPEPDTMTLARALIPESEQSSEDWPFSETLETAGNPENTRETELPEALPDDFVVDPKSELFEELAAMETTSEGEAEDSEQRPAYTQQVLPFSGDPDSAERLPPEVQSISTESPLDFDPQKLSREEAMLPPPQRSLWNLLDWVVVSLIALCILLAVGISFI